MIRAPDAVAATTVRFTPPDEGRPRGTACGGAPSRLRKASGERNLMIARPPG